MVGAVPAAARNTLLFLAANAKGLGKLRAAYRERAALKGVQADYGGQLDQEQQDDLKNRLDAAETSAVGALGPAYTVVLRVAGQDVEASVLGDARINLPEHLSYVWQELVEEEEWILRKIGLVTLKSVGLVPESGGIAVKDAVEAFLKFTDKPIIASRAAVTSGIATACRDGVVGIGRGLSLANLQTRHCRTDEQLDPKEDGVWIIPAFEPVSEKAEDHELKDEQKGERKEGEEGGWKEGGKGEESPRPVRRVTIRGTVPSESWSDIFRSFVNPAVRMQLAGLKLGINFELEANQSAPLDPEDPALKAMKESARQLGLDIEEEN
jgi:hypothetical protein